MQKVRMICHWFTMRLAMAAPTPPPSWFSEVEVVFVDGEFTHLACPYLVTTGPRNSPPKCSSRVRPSDEHYCKMYQCLKRDWRLLDR